MPDRRLCILVLLIALIVAVALATNPALAARDAAQNPAVADGRPAATLQAAVPAEPAPLWLAAMALSGIFVRRRREVVPIR